MKQNIGILDKIIRVIIGVAAYALFLLEITTGWVAMLTVALGTIFLLTAFVNICPLYKLFGVRTCNYNGC